MAKDPVCGMEVDEGNPPARTDYKGQTYYFCAQGCKVAFDKDPEKYLREEAGDYRDPVPWVGDSRNTGQLTSGWIYERALPALIGMTRPQAENTERRR